MKNITVNKFADLPIGLFANYSARALGFEPRSKVLETRMLPLHHARIKAKSYSDIIETAFRICCKYTNFICFKLKAYAFAYLTISVT